MVFLQLRFQSVLKNPNEFIIILIANTNNGSYASCTTYVTLPSEMSHMDTFSHFEILAGK